MDNISPLLIVDDNEMGMKVIVKLLRKLKGIDVIYFTSLKEAENFITDDGYFKTALIDLSFDSITPNIKSGEDLMCLIKTKFPERRIGCISAYNVKSKADFYITKPFSLEKLIDQLVLLTGEKQ